MSKGNTWENDLLKLVFNATAVANIADNAASSPLTNLYVSLHTADPGEGGDQTTSEATYTDYARVAVSRNSGGWTVTGNSVVNAALVQFPQATGGSNTITYVGVGTASSSTGKLLYSGALDASLSYTSTVPASTGGGKVKKPRRVLSWPRFEPVHVVTFRHGAAHVSGASALSARVTATANGAAHIGGASAVKANATVLRIYTQDAEFWLMAA